MSKYVFFFKSGLWDCVGSWEIYQLHSLPAFYWLPFPAWCVIGSWDFLDFHEKRVLEGDQFSRLMQRRPSVCALSCSLSSALWWKLRNIEWLHGYHSLLAHPLSRQMTPLYVYGCGCACVRACMCLRVCLSVCEWRHLVSGNILGGLLMSAMCFTPWMIV